MVASTFILESIHASVIFLALFSAVAIPIIDTFVLVVISLSLDTDMERQGDVFDGTELSTVVQMLVLQSEKVPLPATKIQRKKNNDGM